MQQARLHRCQHSSSGQLVAFNLPLPPSSTKGGFVVGQLAGAVRANMCLAGKRPQVKIRIARPPESDKV